MRILYVTPLWSGFSDIIAGGSAHSRGMPAFIYPLKALLKLGNQIDFVVALNRPLSKPIIYANYLKDSQFDFVTWDEKIGRIRSVLRAYNVISRILTTRMYDLVYAHGSFGVIGCIVANRVGVPTGQRLYGTFLADEIHTSSKCKVLIEHPLEYLSFTNKKSFLIMTNDGTHGDQVYRWLNNGKVKTEFHFLLNGVESFCDIKNSQCSDLNLKEPFIFFPGRIAHWKQQHLGIEILRYLHDMGHRQILLYFAGHISEPHYMDYIHQRIRELKLSDNVKYLGILHKKEMYYCYQRAIAVLSLYQFSNLGNIIIEALSSGAVTISLNDGSLDALIEDGKNGFLINTAYEGAQKVEMLLSRNDLVSSISVEAHATALKNFRTWDERVAEEIDVLYKTVKQ